MNKKSYMSEVAKLLGVELNEEFEVDCCVQSYHLTEEGLFNSEEQSNSLILMLLLAGNEKIIKKSWKPKCGEKYFYINKSKNDMDYTVEVIPWWGESVDYALYSIGNIFKTKEEALKKVSAYKEFIKSVTPNMSWREDNITDSNPVNIAND